MRLHLARARAVPAEDGRECAWCGDKIDPIDWCPACRKHNAPCGAHRSLRKRADAAFCGRACRQRNRNTYISDCLTAAERKALRAARPTRRSRSRRGRWL